MATLRSTPLTQTITGSRVSFLNPARRGCHHMVCDKPRAACISTELRRALDEGVRWRFWGQRMNGDLHFNVSFLSFAVTLRAWMTRLCVWSFLSWDGRVVLWTSDPLLLTTVAPAEPEQASLTIGADARLYGRRHTSVFLHLFGL
jgi:hypothetical protein